MGIRDFLSPNERYLVKQFRRLERTMSALTDQVDAALAQLQSDVADDNARVAAAESAQALLQAQVDSLAAGNAVDESELQKVLDVLAQLSQPAPVSPPPADGGDQTPPADSGDQPPADANPVEDQPVDGTDQPPTDQPSA